MAGACACAAPAHNSKPETAKKEYSRAVTIEWIELNNLSFAGAYYSMLRPFYIGFNSFQTMPVALINSLLINSIGRYY